MPETIKDCKCIDRDDKHELSKAVLARIELYHKSIADLEMEDAIERIESVGIKTIDKNAAMEEVELKPSPKSAKKISQYREIISRLEGLYDRLENTPECK